LEAAATRPWVLRLFAAVFTELLDGLFTELLDALFTELFDTVLTVLFAARLTELLDAVFTELFVDDLAATALPRDPPLLTCFDLEEAFAAATFGLLGVGDLAVLGLAGIGGAAVSTLAGLSTAVGDEATQPNYFIKPSSRAAFSLRISGRTSGLMSSVSKSAIQRSGVSTG